MGVGACHDAARKAVTAHMHANGYRAANAAGAHRLVVEDAAVVLGGIASVEDATDLDYLRRDRHIAEYGDFASRSLTSARVREAIALGARITSAIADALAGKGPRDQPAELVGPDHG